MKITSYTFDRVEFAGSLGDLGTLIPISVSLMVITGLSVTPVLLMVGLFYIFSGLYFKLPIPVQPLKVMSVIAIAYPLKISVSVMAAAGITFGVILLVLSMTGAIDTIGKWFKKPVVRGIQLGLGFILINKGIGFILKPDLLIQQKDLMPVMQGIPINTAIGFLGGFITLLLLSNKRFPATLVIIAGGIITGIIFGALDGVNLSLGPSLVQIHIPGMQDFINAFFLLVIPQIPLTIGNAIIGTSDVCKTLFGNSEHTKKATYRGFATSMGLTNIVTGIIAGMPMCHGAGGVAAHYRFGARTGGSNIMIGTIFIIIALVFGQTGIALLSLIPNGILGVLLLFAGLELVMLIKDIKGNNDLFISFFIAGIGFATTNMAIAFFIGIFTMELINRRKIKL
jgi:SulP family sulfate permease